MVTPDDAGTPAAGDPAPWRFPASAPSPARDSAPWGLAGAILVPAAALGGQVLVAFLVGAFARFCLITFDPNLADHPDVLDQLVIRASLLPVALGSALLTLGIVFASIRAAGAGGFREALGLRSPDASSALFACAGGVVALASLGLMVLFPPDDLEAVGGPMTELARSGPVGHAIWVALAIIVAPVVEEILFRGFAYSGAKRRLGVTGAAAAVTAVFVTLHLGETGAFWPAIAGISGVGVLLVAIRERTGNLTHCIACHLGYNAALAGVSFLGG